MLSLLVSRDNLDLHSLAAELELLTQNDRADYNLAVVNIACKKYKSAMKLLENLKDTKDS
jgi:hypothetical protein